jgi:hypothetical protein
MQQLHIVPMDVDAFAAMGGDSLIVIVIVPDSDCLLAVLSALLIRNCRIECIPSYMTQSTPRYNVRFPMQ